MVTQKELHSPAEMELITPTEEQNTIGNTDDNGKIKIKKQLGLLEGVAIILGIIFGSGIFISPKGVIKEVNSVGLSLVIWILCGILSLIGALCYAELGTSIPKSGGDYAYIFEAYGPVPSFLYLWAANIIFVPTTNAIMGLAFAKYVIEPFFPQCDLPESAVLIMATLAICFLTWLNSVDVKSTNRMQNVFMFCKVGALLAIIIAGVVWVGLGNVSHFHDPFLGTSQNPGKIAKAVYAGIFSYSGWNYLNFMTEELRNPYVNLPRAIYISLPIVTSIYVLANMAYLAVLTPDEMVASDAIAVTFANRLFGNAAWLVPIMVAISAFGGLSVHIMASSRMLFVGARNGYFPEVLSHINITKFTPIASLVFLSILSVVMLFVGDIFVLITYCSIIESFFIMLSVSAILWLRWKQPDLPRPIRVNLLAPIFFVIICLFLIIFPCWDEPVVVGMGALITLSGIPAYYLGILWKNKPRWFKRMMWHITVTTQKLFIATHEEK